MADAAAVLLLAGGTGLLGGRIAGRLADRGVSFRALVRPGTDASELERLDAQIVRGDLLDPDSLEAALGGVSTVVTTVTAMSRLLQGGGGTTIEETDGRGTANLIAASERARVERFLYVSFAGVSTGMRFPLARAKWHNEERLRSSTMPEILLKPDAFQEIWFGPAVGIHLDEGKMTIFGKGENRVRYVAVDDVAKAAVELALSSDPPRSIAFGGPGAISRNELAAGFGRLLGRPLKVRRVPRLALQIGSRALAPFKQELASVMGLALYVDTVQPDWDERPLRELGIEPKPASAALEEAVAELRGP